MHDTGALCCALQVTPSAGRGSSLLMVVDSDLALHGLWCGILDTLADVVLHLKPLPAGGLANANLEVVVERPNRWGKAMPADAASDTSLVAQQTYFASVKDRAISWMAVT